MSTDLPLALQPDTLDGLPSVLHRGLIAVAFCGILSLVTSTTLFVYLTYRLSTWYFRGQLSQGPNQLLLLIYNLLLADSKESHSSSRAQLRNATSLTLCSPASNGVLPHCSLLSQRQDRSRNNDMLGQWVVCEHWRSCFWSLDFLDRPPHLLRRRQGPIDLQQSVVSVGCWMLVLRLCTWHRDGRRTSRCLRPSRSLV